MENVPYEGGSKTPFWGVIREVFHPPLFSTPPMASSESKALESRDSHRGLQKHIASQTCIARFGKLSAQISALVSFLFFSANIIQTWGVKGRPKTKHIIMCLLSKIFASSQVSATPEQPPLQHQWRPRSDFKSLSSMVSSRFRSNLLENPARHRIKKSGSKSDRGLH